MNSAALLAPPVLAALAVALDWLLGEPQRWHPLAGFGRLAQWVETLCHGAARWRGLVALTLLLVPPTLLAWGLQFWLARHAGPLAAAAFSLWALYFAIGHKSLHDHTRPIAAALRAGDAERARQLTARIVSRDAATLDSIPATCESILENGNDGVFAALFWFACAGASGAILYRLANTMDALWGYKSPRYLHFGWAAARFDDLLNWLPARLTALTYALLGHTRTALRCWRTQAPTWKSPNAGPVMAAGAGALQIQLGGAACYRGEWQQRPALGAGAAPDVADIERALALVRHGVLLWLLVFGLLSGVLHA